MLSGHRVVVAVPSVDAGEPAPLIGDRQVSASPQLGLDRAQLRWHPLGVGDALEFEPPVPGLRADVREPQEPEGLRLAETARRSVAGSEPPELDQPRLLVRQFQPERREPSAKIGEEPLGVIPVLEARREIVSKAHENDVPARVPAPPLVGPEVEDVVQVDVREQRRRRSPLRNALHAVRPRPVLDHPCAHPFLDQAQDPAVRDPVLKETFPARPDQAG